MSRGMDIVTRCKWKNEKKLGYFIGMLKLTTIIIFMCKILHCMHLLPQP